MKQAPKALIIGSGIAGLTTAVALRRIGLEVAVFERATDLNRVQVGGGIHLWINAMRALEQVGMADAVKGVGVEVELQQHLTWRGDVLADWPVGALGRASGIGNYGVSRGDLLRALKDGLDVAVRFDSPCSGFDQDADGVTLRFGDGHQERGDVLIGADGARSTIRAQVLGDPSPPRHAGYSIWQGNLDFHHAAAPLDNFPILWGPGARFLWFGAQRDRRMFWGGLANTSAAGSDPEGTTKKFLLDRFVGWAEPVEDIIDATDEGVITRIDIADRDPVRPWTKGRVTLVGDAAHAMTFNLGQGACQAIEDAVVLMKCLQAEPEIPLALRAYEDRRAKRTADITLLARRIGKMGRLQNRFACALRDRAMKLLFGGRVWRYHKEMITYTV